MGGVKWNLRRQSELTAEIDAPLLNFVLSLINDRNYHADQSWTPFLTLYAIYSAFDNFVRRRTSSQDRSIYMMSNDYVIARM